MSSMLWNERSIELHIGVTPVICKRTEQSCCTGTSCLHLSLVGAAEPAPVLPPAPLFAAAHGHWRRQGVRLGASSPHCLLRLAISL